MKNMTVILFTVGLSYFVSCSVEPEKISYGSDTCHFCKMTIVDTQHAAQYVTTKGKQFKFDSVECMLNEMSEKETKDIDIYLVSDYSNPQSMTEANNATYLISYEIKSPMGAFLTAFSEEIKAQELVKTSDDKLYTWSSIKKKYSVK